MNLVVVAIPREDDPVWKISSEKVPHMTILFLGDVEGKPVTKIQEFVEHAVSILELGPFMLDVDYRGELGEDKADVLFFRKNDWSIRRVAAFRGQLLKDPKIKTAYDSTEQYPEWTPHLTLGYPESPAKPDNRDYPGIRWVDFDRIAVWTGDYEGQEFRLEYNDDLAEVAMTGVQAQLAARGQQFLEAHLEHYGVKGMKWGVRNGVSRQGARPVVTKATVTRLTGHAKVKTKGGQAHPPVPDAIKTAAAKQKLKQSGPAALSNDELREVATRLQLEQQVIQLAKRDPNRSLGAKAVGNMLDNPARTIDTVGTAAKAGKELVDLARRG
jgi:2'-5' RNA ligase